MHMNIDRVIEILSDCEYSPKAEFHYDLWRGAFIWDDELPESKDGDGAYLKALMSLDKVYAYRSSLTNCKPIDRFEADWNALKEKLPNWPGFREDRIYGKVERKLKAVQKNDSERIDNCINDLIEELEDDDSI